MSSSAIPTFRSLAQIPNSTASVSDSVLIIIDAQQEYLSGNGPVAIPGIGPSIEANRKLLERYRAAKGDVIHVLHKAVGADAPAFSSTSGKLEAIEGLEPREGESVVYKDVASAFAAPSNLEALVKATGKNKIVIVGYQIHNCIAFTVGYAAALGFETVIPRDCVAVRPLPGVDAETLMRAYLAGMADFAITVVESKNIQ